MENVFYSLNKTVSSPFSSRNLADHVVEVVIYLEFFDIPDLMA
jgi:hypothetical protein